MAHDWRLTGQERYLASATLVMKPYRASETSDHDHCAFCWRKFVESGSRLETPESVTSGYAAIGRGPDGEDDYHWICDICSGDFRDRFDWTVR